MLILLGPFNTRDCYYFESNLGMTFFTKASLTKQHVILQYPNYEESLSLNNLFHWNDMVKGMLSNIGISVKT